ncbi:hypothetical protein [Patulibacter minatonensis]|uniref:hypothetical protein n=1 Tax=Patulibacter minatonensis TaxID=298163 RepID=UPI00047D6B00|nr:hypothetical protein [Patulibacter minatonensis]
MSPTSSTPSPRPTRRRVIPAAVASTTLLALAGAASAGAAAAPPTVQQPLQTIIGTTNVLASVGNRQTVWVTQQPGATDGSVVLSTLRVGAAVPVATLPGPPESGVVQLEVGTAKDGTPVAAVVAVPREGSPTIRLVRLDTGAVRTISSTRQGLPVGGVALDNGRWYYTVHPKRTTSRSTASLWSATLTGTSIGPAKKVRTSRRGESWEAVVADRNRVAVQTVRPVHDGSGVFARDEWAFGTPRGTWKRAGLTYASDGGYSPTYGAGFTQDRSAFVTYQGGFPTGPRATRTPIAGGKARVVTAGADADDDGFLLAPAYDPATGRLLTRGKDATGANTLGWTAPLYP